MTTPLELLVAYPSGQGPQAEEAWRERVTVALAGDTQEWIAAVGPYAGENMPADAAWPLLGWVETVASRVARERDRELVPLSAFALALLGASPIDPRECWIVGTLLRRACELAELPFVELVRDGCRCAGDLGVHCEAWLADVASSTPSTHREVPDDSGRSGFERVPVSIDVERLERWINDGRQ